MTLITQPTYQTTIPSTKEEITYRPYLVKEEKIMLRALASGDESEMISAIKQVLENCITTPVDIKKLTPFDVDRLLFCFKSKAVESKLKKDFTCQNDVNGGLCGKSFSLEIDLDNVPMVYPPTEGKIDGDTTEISLSDNISVIIKHPSFYIMNTLNDNDTDLDKTIKILTNSIQMVYINKIKHIVADMDIKDIQDFLESLTEVQFRKLENFLDSTPYYEFKKSHTCEKCGYNHKFELRGLKDFF